MRAMALPILDLVILVGAAHCRRSEPRRRRDYTNLVTPLSRSY